MLTWGAFNIIGASQLTNRHRENRERRPLAAKAVDAEITGLGIEHDEYGNRAKAFLYCLKHVARRPGGWFRMSPWVISRQGGQLPLA